MYFEIFKHGNLIVRGKKYLGTLEFDHELNLAPSVTMTLEAEWNNIISGREEIKIHFDDCKVFWGIIWNISPLDKVNETITLDIRHVITEWEYRQISVNHAQSNQNLNIVYKGDKVEKNESNGEVITANDFTVMNTKIDGMTNADWIAKAKAVAWSSLNGDSIAVTQVDHSAIKKTEDEESHEMVYKEGTYNVIFKTAMGTSVTVECEVVSEIDMQTRKTKSDKDNKETISAVPFTVYTDAGLTAEQVKKKADPKAWVYRHKKKKVAVTSVTTNFVNVEGEYTLTASTAKGTSITVKIKVEEGNGYSALDDPSVIDKLEDIYADKNFAYEGWQIEWLDDAQNRVIDYVYSRQNKLEALTTTVELTDDLWWRVGWWNEKKVQIGKFGELKPYIISKKRSGKTNIRMIEEPSVEANLPNVINVATVYSDKNDGGMSSLTLREIYEDKDKQVDGFPVVILHANVNNERDYTMYVSQYPQLAPNNETEYAVLDEVSIALESGTLIEGTYSFNDLSPFEIDSNSITNEKRIKSAETVYRTVIKKLIQSRRSYDLHIVTEQLPCDLLAGDRVRLLYDNKVLKMEACSNYWKKIMHADDLYYITRITYRIDEYGVETNEIVLTKWLRIERETRNT